MSEPQPTSYDQVPYPSFAFAQTHPDRLAAVATLFGMDPLPPPVATCRVLELGCAQGDNLIPLALELTAADLVGIDLSARQVTEGRTAIAELGLRNLRLLHGDIAALPPDLGSFDYIIAHGVYSWIPPAVRDAMLDGIRRHLRPDGVAFVSYNTLPGWHLNRIAREMLLYHVRHLRDPVQRLTQAKAFLQFVARTVPEQIPLYRRIFTNVLEGIERAGSESTGFYHDYLEDENEPVYFQQFAAHAARHGLKFLAEAEVSTMQVDAMAPEAAQTLAQLGDDALEREQYIDFLGNRSFRQSLLCHAEARVGTRLHPERLADLWLVSRATPTTPPEDLRSTRPLTFGCGHTQGEPQITTDHPLTKAALLHLGEIWPGAVRFEDLQRAARGRLVPAALVVQGRDEYARDTATLAENLLHAYRADLAEAHAWPPAFSTEISEKPRTSPWIRRLVARGRPLTNLRHAGIQLNDFQRRLLYLLDGTRTREQIVDALVEQVENHSLVVLEKGHPAASGSAARAALLAQLDEALAELARRALLSG